MSIRLQCAGCGIDVVVPEPLNIMGRRHERVVCDGCVEEMTAPSDFDAALLAGDA